MTHKTIIDKLEDYKKKVSKMGIQKLIRDVILIDQRKEEKCYNYGHKPSGKYYNLSWDSRGIKVYEHCSRCNMIYQRNPTPEEQKDFNEKMKTPFDI